MYAIQVKYNTGWETVEEYPVPNAPFGYGIGCIPYPMSWWTKWRRTPFKTRLLLNGKVIARRS